MNCPKCNKINTTKAGIVKGRQRYFCHSCDYHYTVQQRSGTATASIKRHALELYLEGLGFRSIGRILKVSHVAVYNWIKSFDEQLEAIKSDKPVVVTELDEMHTYIGSKKTTAGYGLLLIEMKANLSIVCWDQGESRLVKTSGNQ